MTWTGHSVWLTRALSPGDRALHPLACKQPQATVKTLRRKTKKPTQKTLTVPFSKSSTKTDSEIRGPVGARLLRGFLAATARCGFRAGPRANGAAASGTQALLPSSRSAGRVDTAALVRAGATERVCALEALPLECWRGCGGESGSTRGLSAHFISLCKLSPTKAFRRTRIDTNTLQRRGSSGVRASLPSGAGAGRDRNIERNAVFCCGESRVPDSVRRRRALSS